jgi:hypothetical protein
MFTRLYGGLRTRLNSAPHGLPPRVRRPARCLDFPEVAGDYELRRWVDEIRPMTAHGTNDAGNELHTAAAGAAAT